MRKLRVSALATYLILSTWSAVVLFPLWTMLINSIKRQRDIFRNPFGLPPRITLEGYQSAWTTGRFDVYFSNSVFVTLVSLFFIVFLGSLAAYALANWRSRFASAVYIFFVAGWMVPIRLGSIELIHIMQRLGVIDKTFSLVLVYVAMGVPIAVFILTDFIRAVPDELFDASRIDGASEWHIYATIIVPIIRHALATVAIYMLIPIWNDLWFPLIFIRAEQSRTVIYGVSLLFGQYQTDWTRILSVLSMSVVPVIILYLLMAKQFVQGLTAGAVRG